LKPKNCAKTHLPVRAKFKLRSSYIPLLEVDGISGHSDTERDPPASPASRENGSGPRSREMTPGDKNNIFHATDSQASLLSKPHTVIDMFDYPFAEIAVGDRGLSFCRERKI
jgi:hypothetical protein